MESTLINMNEVDLIEVYLIEVDMNGVNKIEEYC
jgi:hypothetical protein